MKVKLVRGEVVRPFQTRPVGEIGVVSGTVRVLSAREYSDFYEGEFPGLKARLGSARLAEAHLFARCIRTWDVVDENDRPAEVTPENVAALPPDVCSQLGDVVSGAAAAGQALLGNSPASSAS